MKRIISCTEILGSFTRDGREFEVCAAAEGDFEEAESRLMIELDAFIRPVDLRVKEEHLRPDWLPAKQNIKEGVSREDATSLAKEIFHGWVRKILESISFPIHQ